MTQTNGHRLLTPDARGCAGFRQMPRRAALTAGSLGALGLSLGDFFRIRAARGEASSSTAAYAVQAANG